jgi:hypothetical protein
VRLGVVHVLQPVFEAAQEVVGGRQFARMFDRQQPALDEQFEDPQRRPRLQRGIAAAANQLEDLGDELDLADAAGAQLDVLGHFLARHLAADLRVQGAHGIDGAEVEILADRRRGGQCPAAPRPIRAAD